MNDLIVMPDAERMVIEHLSSVLVPPVSLTVPASRPALFLTVQRIGGPRLNLVADNAMLTLEAWGGGPTAAKELLADARAQLHALRGSALDGVAVYQVTEISGPVNLPDPESNQARYTQAFQVALRGATPEDES